jgi:hypothetical protein
MREEERRDSSSLPAASFLLGSVGERLTRISELWKVITNDEKELFKEKAEILKQESKREWDKLSDARDEVGSATLSCFPYAPQERRDWCQKLGLPLSKSWAEIDAFNRSTFSPSLIPSSLPLILFSNRAKWEKKYGISDSKSEKKPLPKKKSKSNESSSSEDDEPMDADGSSKRKLSSSSASPSTDGKKRRVAIDHALLKMKESGSEHSSLSSFSCWSPLTKI